MPVDTASRDGWVAVVGTSETGSMWTKQGQKLHINVLEVLGAKLGLLSFFKNITEIKCIRVTMDNYTVVAYINIMRERIMSDLCDDNARIQESENVMTDKNFTMFLWP